jgi:hypothetical protein
LSPNYKGLVFIGGLTILLSLALAWSARRDLQSARRELAAVTKANDFLKKTLSDMTIAISAKEREIDRLQQSACPGGQEKAQPGTPTRPRHNKVSESGNVRAENHQRIAPAQGVTK